MNRSSTKLFFHLILQFLSNKPVTCRHFGCLENVVYFEIVTRDIENLPCFMSSLVKNSGHGTEKVNVRLSSYSTGRLSQESTTSNRILTVFP